VKARFRSDVALGHDRQQAFSRYWIEATQGGVRERRVDLRASNEGRRALAVGLQARLADPLFEVGSFSAETAGCSAFHATLWRLPRPVGWGQICRRPATCEMTKTFR
jgi:hypothetical protein